MFQFLAAPLAIAPFSVRLAGVVAASGAVLAPAMAAPAGGLAAHRAVYELQLDDASDRSGIAGIYGRMVYEFNGSRCDGYTVSFRFVTRIDTEETSRLTDQQTTTYEDLDAGTFRFVTRSFVDERLDSRTEGVARGTDEGVLVELDEPDEREMTLRAGKFPTEHMLELIEKAEDGTRFYQSTIYDGSEQGDEVMLTTTVVGEKREPAADDAEAAEAGPFAGDSFWPVSIAYFDESDSGDETPTYQIAFKLYDNGLTRDLVMDYGEFSMKGTLTDLEMLEQAECEG